MGTGSKKMIVSRGALIAAALSVVSSSAVVEAQTCPSQDSSFTCTPVTPPCEVGPGLRFASCSGNYVSTASFAGITIYHNAQGPETDFGFGKGWGAVADRVDASGPTVISADGSTTSFPQGQSEYRNRGDLRSLQPIASGGFRLSEADGSFSEFTHQYQGNYFLTTSVDSFGNRTTMTYGTGGIPHTISIPGHGDIVFTFNNNGQVASVSSPDGLKFTLAYRGNGRDAALERVTYPDGRSVSYFYNQDNRFITRQVGVFGSETNVSYGWHVDGDAPVVTGIRTPRDKVRFTYSATTVSVWNNAVLSETEYAFVTPRKAASLYVAQERSGRGPSNELPVIDAIHMYEDTPDGVGRLASSTEPDGTTQYFYGSQSNCVASSAPTDSPLPTCIKTPLRTTHLNRDSRNLFRPVRITEKNPLGGTVSTTSYTWNGSQLLSKAVTDSSGRPVSSETRAFAQGSTAPTTVTQTSTARITWDMVKGLVQESVSAAGNKKNFSYNRFGYPERLVSDGITALVSTRFRPDGTTSVSATLPALGARVDKTTDLYGGNESSLTEFAQGGSSGSSPAAPGIKLTRYSNGRTATYRAKGNQFASLNQIVQETTGLSSLPGSRGPGEYNPAGDETQTRGSTYCSCQTNCPETQSDGTTESGSGCGGCGERAYTKDVCSETDSSSSSSSSNSFSSSSSVGYPPPLSSSSSSSSWSSSSSSSSTSSQSSSSLTSSSSSSSQSSFSSSKSSSSSSRTQSDPTNPDDPRIPPQPPIPLPPDGSSSSPFSSQGSSSSTQSPPQPPRPPGSSSAGNSQSSSLSSRSSSTFSSASSSYGSGGSSTSMPEVSTPAPPRK